MKKILKTILVIIIIVIFVGTIVYLYKKSQDKPVIYQTKTPFISNIVKKTVATGSVIPRKEIDIKPQVSGIIKEIFVEPGQKVNDGDLIAKVKIIPNMINLNNAESRVKKAKLQLKDSKLIYQRQKKIYNQGVIPKADFQKYEINYENAKEELNAANNNLQLIKEGATKNAGESSNTLIRSTIKGMILDVPVEEGNSVIEANNFNDGTTIASIADMSDMIFEGKVDESEVGKIHEGMALVLTIGAIEDESFNAILEYIAPKGMEENGAVQFEIKAKVKLDKDNFIRAGYSANANIVLEKKDSIMVIPEGLIKFEGDTAFVEIETEPQVFERKEIELGISDGINIEVTKGLTIDTKIKDENAIVENPEKEENKK
ncbi:MAG: efflux RND transporter periplasmic adaptor subunit [Bacteroidota bacterium]|nr:efflux RND transporter periplasmic adaptor subunit [Bacteroidota bacterium]